MKSHIPFAFLYLLVTGLALAGCHKEYLDLDKISDEVELRPEIVIPLIHGSLSMSDITELFDSVEYIGEFEDGLIYLAYSDVLVSVDADTAVVPELETSEFYLEADDDIPGSLPVPVGDTFFLARRTKNLDFYLEGDDRIDEVTIKGGTLRLDLKCSFKHEGILTITSPQILDPEGNAFMQTLFIDDATGDFMETYHFPTDYFLIDPLVRNDSNIIYMHFDLAMINSGQPISPGESCVIQATLVDAGFYSVFGFIDTRDLINESGSLDIPLWVDNPDLKSLTFRDPRIELNMESSIGIPFEIDLDNLIATGIDGTEVALLLDGGNTLEFYAPGMDQIGETVTTQIQINNTTSNIQDFLAVAPANIFYSVRGRTSTTGEDTTHFILDSSRLELSLEFLLPLDLKSAGFALADTLEFSGFGEGKVDTSMIKNVEVTLTTINQLPVELELQIYFLDSLHAELDSVFDDAVPILGASEVDLEGKLVRETLEIQTVEFPSEKLGKLEKTSYLKARARITTSGEGGQFVKIYSHYTLDFRVSMLANLRINSREL